MNGLGAIYCDLILTNSQEGDNRKYLKDITPYSDTRSRWGSESKLEIKA